MTPATNKDLSSLSTEEKRRLLAQLLEKKLRKEKSVYPLSYAQRAMWFLYQMAPEEPTYNAGFAGRIYSDVDVAAFRDGFQELINRHSTLRTTFTDDSGKPVQEVHGYRELHFEQVDASAWDEQHLFDMVLAALHAPFNLREGPVLRVSLFTISEVHHVFLVVAHHIVFDAGSLWILLNEFRTVYSAKKAGKSIEMPALSSQYVDYINWETEMVKGPSGNRHWEYWRQQLAGELPVLNLPTDRPRPPAQTHKGASYFFKIDKKLTQSIRSLAQAEGATLFMTLLATFQVLLYRYTSQEDFLVGTAVTCRNRPEFAAIVGYLVNAVPLRASMSDHLSFRQLLQQARRTVLEMLEHGEYPFPLLVERLKPERDPSRLPLYQVMFDLQKAQQSQDFAALLASRTTNTQIDFGGLALETYQIPQQEGLADLVLQLVETDEELLGALKYNTDLFDPATIARMSEHLLILLDAIATDPEQKISRLPLLAGEERHQLLIDWHQTESNFTGDKCIHQLVEDQARRTPDATAVVFEERHLTYRELNSKADRLANHLRTLGVRAGTLVGICVDRSLEMIIGLLGILKAGGAYVPLDPTYPAERLAFMLADSQVPILLTQQSLLATIPAHNAQVVCLDADWNSIDLERGEDPAESATKESLAYVIYTSGSTGKPKGTLLAHRGLTNVCEAQMRAFDLQPSDHILQFSSLNFDASTFEIFMALTSGATLYLAKKEDLLPGLPLARFLRDQAITIVTLPPSVLAALPKEEFPSLRIINVAGETCPAELVSRWRDHRRFFNLYGPTETTIWATMAECTDGEEKPTIGRPIPNLKIYILDGHMQPVPIGVPGELHIGGVGLARGYLNRPDLTAAKFVPNPFGQTPDDVLYKTGDLTRYRSNGDIEFLGRIDHQVKIRGFRVELGEIESVLEQYPSVLEAKVIVKGNESTARQIAAYLKLQPGQELIKSELLSYLRTQLPDFMIPPVIEALDVFPLTPNGKLDIKALPEPSSARPDLQENYVAPQTDVEQTIATIWQDALQVEKVGIHDNFFDLGGHSLLVAQVHSKLSETLHINDLPMVKLFQFTTVNALAKYLGEQEGGLPSLQLMNERAERQKAAQARQKQLMRKVKQSDE